MHYDDQWHDALKHYVVLKELKAHHLLLIYNTHTLRVTWPTGAVYMYTPLYVYMQCGTLDER